nr:MAG TPA: hypothetical protein [Caudoviricetes sp.]
MSEVRILFGTPYKKHRNSNELRCFSFLRTQCLLSIFTDIYRYWCVTKRVTNCVKPIL